MITETLRRYSVHIAIVIAFMAGIFSYTTLQFPLSAWIWPAALIFAVRSVSVKKGILISVIVIAGSTFLGFFVPIKVMVSESWLYLLAVIVMMLLIAAVYAVPFVIDRLFYGRIGTVRQLFVFPLVLSTVSFLLWMLPLGSIVSFAYSQTNFLYFTQGLSIYGMLGMIFILGWFATSANLFIRAMRDRDKDIKWTAVCAVVIIAVIVFGGVRLSTAGDTETIDVMYAEGPFCTIDESGLTLSDQIAVFDQVFDTAIDDGAGMIVFYEESFFLKEEWIAPFETHAAERSDSSGIYVVLASRVEEGGVRHNTCTLVTPENGAEWRYNKTNLVPTMEDDVVSGDGTIYFTDTPIGRITAVICMDLEFPYFINGIDKDADMLVAPSYDWEGLEGWNARNTSLRSIENGVSLIKATMDGTSSTYDRYGRLISTYTALHDAPGTTYMMSASTEGCTTFYGEYGHVIDWTFVVCTILILLSCIYTCRHGRGE